ncbi:MAG TPA: cyclic nucleotide-binding domain-containing protein [Rhodospirillales bacterium]|nr:cyclic nucleotide-binding domain-containing protein [Rhodospirillales bacterium]HIL74307.1 cyclic nucleotide-binding domain-containing protein [Rhodospirillales bacterium]
MSIAVPGDRFGLIFDRFIIALILLNILAIMLETVASINASYENIFYYFEVFSVAVFTIEYLLRVWSCTEDKVNDYSNPITGRIKYIMSPMAIIDLLAFLPFYLTMFFAIDLRILRILRMLRLLKLTRYSEALSVVWAVLTKQRRALTAAFFIMLVALLFTSSIIYLFEHKVQPEKFSSIPESMWWALATLTTVGYGDVTPITNGGKLFAGMTMILAIGLAALPIGVIATGFANEIQKHEFIVTWRLIAKVPLFSDLNADQIANIAGMLTPLLVPPGHVVVKQGDNADAMFFIITGEVEVEIKTNPVILRPGDFFGEAGILRESVRMADVISQTECQLLELRKEKFNELIRMFPELGVHVEDVMESRINDNTDITTKTLSPS